MQNDAFLSFFFLTHALECRHAKGLELSEGPGLTPPSPLMTIEESKAYTRELHTVNVGTLYLAIGIRLCSMKC